MRICNLKTIQEEVLDDTYITKKKQAEFST